ncbi:MAG: hypothetical protein IIA41_06315, partial [SAR324 cluster bacterium]|nr:hypothetical protein [SAR324 cluster bacterium]
MSRTSWGAAGLLALGMGCGFDIPAESVETPSLIEGQLEVGDFELQDGSVADGFRLLLDEGDEQSQIARAPRLIAPTVEISYERILGLI